MNLSKLESAGVAVVNKRQTKQIFSITGLLEKSLSIR